jgi:hypothetical protein
MSKRKDILTAREMSSRKTEKNKVVHIPFRGNFFASVLGA